MRTIICDMCGAVIPDDENVLTFRNKWKTGGYTVVKGCRHHSVMEVESVVQEQLLIQGFPETDWEEV